MHQDLYITSLTHFTDLELGLLFKARNLFGKYESVNWSTSELAKRWGVSLPTVKRFMAKLRQLDLIDEIRVRYHRFVRKAKEKLFEMVNQILNRADSEPMLSRPRADISPVKTLPKSLEDQGLTEGQKTALYNNRDKHKYRSDLEVSRSKEELKIVEDLVSHPGFKARKSKEAAKQWYVRHPRQAKDHLLHLTALETQAIACKLNPATQFVLKEMHPTLCSSVGCEGDTLVFHTPHGEERLPFNDPFWKLWLETALKAHGIEDPQNTIKAVDAKLKDMLTYTYEN